LLADHS
jgi:hydroxyacylglutathione hydrolase